MKPTIKILLLGVGLFLSASVVFAGERCTLIIVDDGPQYSHATAPENIVLFAIHYDLLASLPLSFDVCLVNTQTPYIGLKLNHKALPLTKKIWLINCQIAFK